MLVDAQIQFLTQSGQQLHAGDAVAVLVQGRGENADAHLFGNDAHNAPPTPLLAGKPTVMANSPEPSYIPQVASVALTYFANSAGKSCSFVSGWAP